MLYVNYISIKKTNLCNVILVAVSPQKQCSDFLNFVSIFAGADWCFGAYKTAPFHSDLYTCILPGDNMAFPSAFVNHTNQWMAFKRVCLNILNSLLLMGHF